MHQSSQQRQLPSALARKRLSSRPLSLTAGERATPAMAQPGAIAAAPCQAAASSCTSTAAAAGDPQASTSSCSGAGNNVLHRPWLRCWPCSTILTMCHCVHCRIVGLVALAAEREGRAGSRAIWERGAASSVRP